MILRNGLLFCGLLVGCAVPRPEDAYEPEPLSDPASEVEREFEKDTGPVTARPIATPVRDAGSSAAPVDAGSQVGEPEDDAGEPLPPSPLEAFTGYYLMRMDMYSRWETSKPVPTIVRNRVSNLLFVEVVLEDGKLVGHESICDQTYEHVCEKGCISWETKLHPDVKTRFAEVTAQTRAFEYDEATRALRAGASALSLGFDELSGQADLPTDKSDPRVWKLSAGNGVYTLLSATAGVGSLRQELSCSVASVQRFPSTYAGTLDQQSLEGEFELEVAIEAADIEISGGTRCTRDTVDNSDPQDTEQVVRMKRVSAAECPSNFDATFPGRAP